MTERIRKALDFVKAGYDSSPWFERNPGDGLYRWEHSMRVAHIGAEIARRECLDEEALTIACILHDIAYSNEIPEGGWNEHGRVGARMARPFLESLELSPETVNEILYGIAIHVDDKADFEGRRCPFTETVGDADNIDRFDTYRIYETVRYQLQPEEHTLSEKLDWLRQRLDRLDQLGKMNFGTPTATALWQDKVEYQKTFFGRLLKQMEASYLPEEMEEKQ